MLCQMIFGHGTHFECLGCMQKSESEHFGTCTRHVSRLDARPRMAVGVKITLPERAVTANRSVVVCCSLFAFFYPFPRRIIPCSHGAELISSLTQDARATRIMEMIAQTHGFTALNWLGSSECERKGETRSPNHLPLRHSRRTTALPWTD